MKTSERCDFVNTIWPRPDVSYVIHVRAQSHTNTHSHILKQEDSMDKQWDKSVKQLSMQCHVRTVCSTISTQESLKVVYSLSMTIFFISQAEEQEQAPDLGQTDGGRPACKL